MITAQNRVWIENRIDERSRKIIYNSRAGYTEYVRVDLATPRPEHSEAGDGWRLVPVEPTEAMLNNGASAHPETRRSIWKAMLEAAPYQPKTGEGWNATIEAAAMLAQEYADGLVDNEWGNGGKSASDCIASLIRSELSRPSPPATKETE
jgi:hypothetical protein